MTKASGELPGRTGQPPRLQPSWFARNQGEYNMLTVRLPHDMEKRLSALSRATNRSKSYYARRALRHVVDNPDVEIQNIDWNTAWYSAQRMSHFKPRRRGADFWNRGAPGIARGRRRKRDFPGQFLNILKPEKHWRVLDVGCGTGTLALALAHCVAAVTALDFSDNVLSLLELETACAAQQLKNITPVLGTWNDAWEDMGIVPHDVVIASRCLIAEDLNGFITRLNRFAKERVYISATVGDGPFDPRIIEAAGRVYHSGPDYIYVLNQLHQMGIYANLAFTVHPVKRTYADHEDALQQSLWMVDCITLREQDRLRRFFKKNLTRKNGRWVMPGMAPVRWAVMWWDTPR
jgi:predicted transcriptional regulator